MGNPPKLNGNKLFAVLVGGVRVSGKAFSPPVFHPANATLVRCAPDGQIMSI
jgi:hypothetical protein